MECVCMVKLSITTFQRPTTLASHSYIGDMLTLGTYDTNMSHELKPSKYRHISQNKCNTFNKHINISNDDHVIIHGWNAYWMQFLIQLYVLISRLLMTCYLNSGPYIHTLLHATMCRGELPQSNTSPQAKNIPRNALNNRSWVRKECMAHLDPF